MIRKKITRFVLFCAISSLLCCTSNESNVEAFFVESQRLLENDEEKIIEGCDSVGCLIEFVFTAQNDRLKYHFYHRPQDLEILLKENGVLSYPKLCYFIAFSKWLREEDYSFKEIESNITQYFEKSSQLAAAATEKYLEDLQAIAQSNWHAFNEGDSMVLELPLKYNERGPYVVYLGEYSSDSFKDTLVVKSILTEKIILEEPLPNNKGYYFKVQIVEMNHECVGWSINPVCIGEKVRVNLLEYGRLIKRL